MDNSDLVLQLRTDLNSLTTVNQHKNATIVSLKQQIADLNARAAATPDLPPELTAVITDLHTFAQAAATEDAASTTGATTGTTTTTQAPADTSGQAEQQAAAA